MARRQAIGEWFGLAGVVLFVIGSYFTWSYMSLAVLLGISIVLCCIGAVIAPPTWWRWGKYPVAIKDPSHERKV